MFAPLCGLLPRKAVLRTRRVAAAVLLLSAVLLLLQESLREGSVISLRTLFGNDERIFLTRFDRPSWPPTKQTRIGDRFSRRNRVLISSLPSVLGDGLGHRFAMVNLELFLCYRFNLGYAHRQSLYGSLTPANDVYAIERLFGWVEGLDFRYRVLRTSCACPERVHDECENSVAKNVWCAELRSRAEGGEFDELVVIPPDIVDCFIEGKDWVKCQRRAKRFFKLHSGDNIMFQMTPHLCHREYRTGYFFDTGDFFRERYWQCHGKYGRCGAPAPSPAPDAERCMGMFPPWTSRTLTLDVRRIQVAVHVRRGDFVMYTSRQSIPDVTYADMVCEVKRALDIEIGSGVGLDVHIYSEGLARDGHIRNNHNVSAMVPVYINEHGDVVKDGHWERLISKRMRRMRRAGGTFDGIRVQMHIASDTVQALHDMIAADFFVGSQSGMSMQIVATYARGIAILPLLVDEPIRGGENERHLKFAYTSADATGIVRRDKLEERVAISVKRDRLHLTQ